MGNAFSQMRCSSLQYLLFLVIASQPQLVQAWNDHYDKEDDAWVMKIFFPIIAALILLCLGSCGYANYCKPQTENNEDEEVDRHEEVYSLNKPDRPYLTPHYQRRTFQPPPPAYDNHAFRPGQGQPGPPSLQTAATTHGPKSITASSIYQSHNPAMSRSMGPGAATNAFMGGPGQMGQQMGQPNNAYPHFNPQFNQNQAIKPNPLRSYSFQVPQQNDIYGERSKSLWDVPQNQFKEQKPAYQPPTNGRTSPIQSTRSAPAGMNHGLRRTFSSPNLGPDDSMNPYGQSYDNYNNQFNQNQFSSHRGSVRYGNNPYQRTPSPASSSSTYIPAASEVGSTAPLFSRRRSPNNGNNMYDNHGFGGNNARGGYQDNNRGRSYEMEDIYGGRGGMHRGGGYNQNPYDQQNQYGNMGQNNQMFQNNQFQNQQFQNNQFNQPNNQNFQDSSQFNNNSVYEHLTPTQYNDPYGMDQGGQQQGNPNLAYDPYDNNNTNLPGY